MGDLAISNLTNNNEEIVEKEVKEIVEVKPKKNKEIDRTVLDFCLLAFFILVIERSSRSLDVYKVTKWDKCASTLLACISLYGIHLLNFRK